MRLRFANIRVDQKQFTNESTTETKQNSLDDLSGKCNSMSFNGEVKWKLYPELCCIYFIYTQSKKIAEKLM